MKDCNGLVLRVIKSQVCWLILTWMWDAKQETPNTNGSAASLKIITHSRVCDSWLINRHPKCMMSHRLKPNVFRHPTKRLHMQMPRYWGDCNQNCSTSSKEKPSTHKSCCALGLSMQNTDSEHSACGRQWVFLKQWCLLMVCIMLHAPFWDHSWHPSLSVALCCPMPVRVN